MRSEAEQRTLNEDRETVWQDVLREIIMRWYRSRPEVEQGSEKR